MLIQSQINDIARDFSELGVEQDTNSELFNCDYSSIDDVINKPAIFTAYQTDVATANGTRCLIAYTITEGNSTINSAFFTSSAKLISTITNPKVTLPFRGMIKLVAYGLNYGFKFVSAKEEVTDIDMENFRKYKRNKFKY